MFELLNVVEPKTISEAVAAYRENPNLRIIAGGTDVLIRLRHRDWTDVALLSLRNVEGLDRIDLLDDGTIAIGAMVNFSQLFRDPVINRHIPVLAEAAVSMGGPQVRNMATIGGNICNGAVSADSATTLLALNAELKLISPAGERIVPIGDFYEGPGKVRLLPGEILTAFLISKTNYVQTAGRYIKFSNRKAMDIAMLGVSVVCKVVNGRFDDLRIALGVAAPTPIRCAEAESYAKNKEVSEETIAETARLTLKASKARDSWRASKAYREHLIETLTQRALQEVVKRGCELESSQGGSRNE